MTSLRGADLQQTNQPVEHAIELLELYLKLNRLQWCLGNGMELSDMSGFIDRISYRDYDTFVHTSELGHFSRLACGQKRVIENSPSRGSLFWFAVEEEDFFFFFLKEQFKKNPSLYPTIPPTFFFTIFLTHCGEIHYETAPFFIILPRWWRERRDRLSRIDNEQGDWLWGEGKEKKGKK